MVVLEAWGIIVTLSYSKPGIAKWCPWVDGVAFAGVFWGRRGRRLRGRDRVYGLYAVELVSLVIVTSGFVRLT